MIRVTALLASLIAALPIGQSAHAQPYPAKPIRIIMPFPAGGPCDVIARAIGREIAVVVKDPEFRATFTDKQDLMPVGSLPHAFADFIRKDRDFWGPIVKASGVALD